MKEILIRIAMLVSVAILGMGCAKNVPAYTVATKIPSTASPIAISTYVIVELPHPTTTFTLTPSFSPTPTFFPTPTPTCKALLDDSRILGEASKFDEAFLNLAALEANPDCQSITESIRDVKAEVHFKFALDALAEQRWDEAIDNFDKFISDEDERYAVSKIIVTKNNAPITGFLDTDRDIPIFYLSNNASLDALGKYLDSSEKTWVLVYAPVFTSSLGIIAPEYFSSDAIQSLTTISQADPSPELKGHSALAGIAKAYRNKIQELEKIEDFPNLVAAYDAIDGYIWLRSFFPQGDKLKDQVLRNSYEKGMSLLDKQSPDELEKYFLPVITSSKDPALVTKARKALQPVYAYQIDTALSNANANSWGWRYNYCDNDLKRPPLMGLALRPERQKIVGWDFQAGSNLGAKSTDEARFIVCIKDSNRTVQKALYKWMTLGGEITTLTRFQRVRTISIRDVLTGKQIGQQTLAGSMPRPFEKTEHSDVYGDFPDTSSIEAWITSKQLPRTLYDQPEDWLKLAREALQAAQLDLAITGLNAVINLNPGDDQSYWERALAYLGQSQWEPAIVDVEKVLNLEPNQKMSEAIENIQNQLANNPGGLMCWGAEQKTPVDVPGLDSGVVKLDAGKGHICALTVGGFGRCWQDSWDIRFGDFTAITGYVTGYGVHACGLTADGKIKCWGNPGSILLGYLSAYGHEYPVKDLTVPIEVPGLSSPAKAISMGENHACVLTVDGGVKCWGDNSSGQLGDGTNEKSSSLVDVVGLGSGITAISAGKDYTCALTTDGGVKCWGANNIGQLGDGTSETRNVPVDVVGLNSGIAEISASGNYTCALTVDGGLKCWGGNWAGQLGDGTNEVRPSPMDVVGLSRGVSEISLGPGHACALMVDGGLKCWGWNGAGQLGDGTEEDRNIPVDVVELNGRVESIAMGDDFTCALTVEGGVKCWGANNVGQLGDGSNLNSNTPMDVIGLSSGVMAIAVSSGQSCALIKPSP